MLIFQTYFSGKNVLPLKLTELAPTPMVRRSNPHTAELKLKRCMMRRIRTVKAQDDRTDDSAYIFIIIEVRLN